MFQQIQDLGIPMILIVNQIDQAERRGITIDIQKFSDALGIKIIQTNAKEQIGIDEVREAVYNNEFVKTDQLSFETPNEHRDFIQKLAAHKGFDNEYKAWMSLSLGTDLGRIGGVMEQLNEPDSKSLVPKRLQVQETVRRYQNVDKILADVIFKKAQFKELLTEKLDKVLVHKFWGYVVFLAILLIIFQSVFFLAEYKNIALILTFMCGALSMSIASPINIMMMKAAPKSEMMAAAFMQAGFNIANAMGAFLGGIPLEYGYSFNYPSLVGVGMTFIGLVISVRYMYLYGSKTQNEEEIAAECVSCDK